MELQSLTPLVTSSNLPNFWTGQGFTSRVVFWLGVFTLALLVTSAILTMGRSVKEYVKDQRRETLQEELRPELRSRIEQVDPGWDAWIASLTDTECTVLKEVMLDELQRVEGKREQRLQSLGDSLNLKEKALNSVRSITHYERLRGLGLLDALGISVTADFLATYLRTDRSEMEVAAHVLASDATNRDKEWALQVLLEYDCLTVYGMEGLFKLFAEDPTLLLEHLARKDVIADGMRHQALLVLERAGIPGTRVDMTGVLESLEHDEPRIRADAYRVLGQYGWHTGVRSEIDHERIVSDPSASVRTAAYQMLESWGDSDARGMVAAAVEHETDERARVTLSRALSQKAPESLPELKAEGTFSDTDRSWATISQVIENQPNPLL